MKETGILSCNWSATPLYQVRVKTNPDSIFCRTIAEFNNDLVAANDCFEKQCETNQFVSLCTRNTGQADGYTCGGNGYGTIK